MTHQRYSLADEARTIYQQRMAGRPRSELPAFEEYVMAVCDVCGELRRARRYTTRNNELPADSTLAAWRRLVKKAMVN